MFEAIRRLAGNALLAAFYAIAPSTVPHWRLDPGLPPAVVLPIGEPVPSLSAWAGGRR